MDRILVVCVGNICRSPLGERLLKQALPDRFSVSSAGIAAVVGHAADATMLDVAAGHDVSLDGHVARQFSAGIGAAHDLILVMEAGHKTEITRLAPQIGGRCLLFDRWTGAKGIADPYRRPRAAHETAYAEIAAATSAWVARLSRG